MRNIYGLRFQWINKLEKKYGKYAINDLMKYMTVLYAAGYLISMLRPEIYINYLALNFAKIFDGQVWRIFTFLLKPPYLFDRQSSLDIIWAIIGLYLYLMIGRSLENAWGSFRFNLFYFMGLLFTIVGAFLAYIIFGNYSVLTIVKMNVFSYVHQTMFLAFAMLYPDIELLLFFVIPVKVKYLGIFYGVVMGYELFSNMLAGFLHLSTDGGAYLSNAIIMICAVLNLLVYYLDSKGDLGAKHKQKKRSKEYAKKLKATSGKSKHECEVCKKTSDEYPDLSFRYCSKCDGNHEYCSEHIFTHEHIKKIAIVIDKDDLK